MMRKLFLACLAMLTAVPALADDISGAVTVNGVKRSYIGYLPKNLGENQPLLISCHGMNQDANYQKGMLDIKSVADAGKFLTIFPEGEGKSWDIGGDKDINFMKVLIDEMVTKYKIDRNRVYLSGFSMGGMFTYHAMNRMADKIAAFAPISGYPMGGTNINASVRPLPVIHTHGTSDDVVGFGGVQGALNAVINHNGCSKTAKVETRYRGASHITRRTWSGGKDGVEVVLMEMADKGHWISNDNGVKTGEEIWKFCKEYSLKAPKVVLESPKSSQTYLSFGGAADVPGLTMEATAKAADGETLAKVEFFDNSKLLATFNEPPYTLAIEGLTKGTHTLKAVATDGEGHSAASTMDIIVEEPTKNTSYSFYKQMMNCPNAVPEGWVATDGSTTRVGYKDGFTSGSRVMQFTGANRAFDWGFYTRSSGKTRGYIRYGDPRTSSSMTLYPGSYTIQLRVASYARPALPAATVAIETIDGEEVFAQVVQPTVCIGGSTKDFTNLTLENVSFDIFEKGRYVLTIYSGEASGDDIVVGHLFMKYKGVTAGISDRQAESSVVRTTYYNLSGQQVDATRPGVYVERSTMSDGRVVSRKVLKEE